MGYKEAVEDNIKIKRNETSMGRTVYYPKCSICGVEMLSYNYIRKFKYICERCRIKMHMEDKEKKASLDTQSKDRKLDNAIKRIKKQVGNKIKEYERPVEIIKKYLYRDKWFESTEEIMVALELIRRKIKLKHQVKMGIYRVDFILPDEKVVLEVDGTIFHTEKTKEKEDVRDNVIILNLGPSWEVVRITDVLINQNIRRLLPAIRAVRDKSQKIRKENDGMLPEWYSNRS